MVTATRIKAAWAVVLTSSNDYIKGVMALKHALHDLHKSEYPLLVLYTPSVVPEVIKTLIDIGCVMKPIDPIHPMGSVEYKSERFAETWTKLAVWNQDDYDRLVLLDADMLPLRNMDELIHMHLPNNDWVAAAYACVCNPQKIKHYPASWIPENCAYTGRDATACTDPTPVGVKKADYFNSGLIVLNPDTSKFDAMVAYLNSISDLNIYPFPDQDFLNEIFKAKWQPISYVYNALKTLQWAHEPMWDVNQVKNVHYILTKPWDIDLQQDLSDLENIYQPLYKLWWNSYSQITQTMSNMKQLNLVLSQK